MSLSHSCTKSNKHRLSPWGKSGQNCALVSATPLLGELLGARDINRDAGIASEPCCAAAKRHGRE